MKNMEQKKDKIQGFEWAMLLVAIGIIAGSVYYVEGTGDNDMATNNNGQGQALPTEEPNRSFQAVPIDQRLLQPASNGRRWDNLGLERRNLSSPNDLFPTYPIVPTPTIPQGMDTSASLPAGH